MTIYHAAQRERLTKANQPSGCPVFSSGMFLIRGDGTGRFDRHYHDYDEFWLVAEGSGTVSVGNDMLPVTSGDIIYTSAGQEHDIVMVGPESLRLFWLSLNPPPGGSTEHLYKQPEEARWHLVPVAPLADEAMGD